MMLDETKRRAHLTGELVARQGVRIHWNGRRIARLGFLIGLGRNAEEIAQDLLMDGATANNIYRQAHRFGVSFRDALEMGLTLPPAANDNLDAAAAKRGLEPEAVIKRLLLELAADPSLIDNVLS